jgi:hypothetical protein
METPLNEIAQRLAEGTLKIPIKTFPLDQVVEAHISMDENTAGAKIVVLVRCKIKMKIKPPCISRDVTPDSHAIKHSKNSASQWVHLR